MNGFGNGDFLLQALAEFVDDLRRDAVRPQEFLKVQRIHVHDGLVTYRDGGALLLVFLLFPGSVAAYAKQGAGTDDIVPTVGLEELQSGAGFRALLQFVKDKAGFAWNERGTRNHGGKIHHNIVHFL